MKKLKKDESITFSTRINLTCTKRFKQRLLSASKAKETLISFYVRDAIDASLRKDGF